MAASSSDDWDHPDDLKWKVSARQTLNSFYQQFQGSQWDEYDVNVDKNLLLAKVCMAMFGTPTEEITDDADLCMGYKEEQRKSAEKIVTKILDAKEKANDATKIPTETILVGIIFICCKLKDIQYIQPIFSVFLNGDPTDPAKSTRVFVDTHQRTYQTWGDWKANNTQPADVKYAYPRRGFFTCSALNQYQFDATKEPDVEFGSSPQSSDVSRFFRKTDIVGAAASIGCAVIGIATFFTPVGPLLLAGSAYVGTTSAVYCSGRAVNRLVDKKKHREQMTDLESITLALSIVALPLSFASSFMNATLVQGAQVEGRLMSASTRMSATIINFSKLGIDTALFSCSIVNLVEKHQNDSMTTLDVIQFSMSLFFFTNTLIQPKFARTIIENAQDARIQQYANSMKDDAAKATYERYYNDNKGRGNMYDKSKIIRNINKIDNPDVVFGGLQDSAKIKIGGRKGRTLLVTDQSNTTTRINPSKVNFTTKTYSKVDYAHISKKLERYLDKDLKSVKINGKNILSEQALSDHQKARLCAAMKTAQNDADIVKTSFEIAEMMHCEDADQLASIMQIVAAEVKKQGLSNISKFDAIANITANKEQFIADINQDITRATEVSSQLTFEDPFQAVYHYRKHGTDFGSSIDLYLDQLPGRLVNDHQFVKQERCSDGTILKYYQNAQDQRAVVAEGDGTKYLKTIFQKDGCFEQHNQRMADAQAGGSQSPAFISDLPQQIAQMTGLHGAQIYVNLEKDRVKLE